MDNKLVIKATNKADNGFKPIFVSGQHYMKLKELSSSTGQSMRDLAEMMLDFAFDNIEIDVSADGVLPK
jgi:hypothetical protein